MRVSAATGDWLIFTDSDCVPSANWIADYFEHFSDAQIGAVAGCIKPYSPTNAVQKSLSLFTLPENLKDIVHDNFSLEEGLFPTANLAVRRDVFNEIGGFREELFYGEDHELCSRIYKAGYKIKSVKDSVIEHIHRSTSTGLMKQAFNHGTEHPYRLRHLSQGTVVIAVPFMRIEKRQLGIYLWIDFIQADKKLLLCILLGLVWPPLLLLVPLYFLYLCHFVKIKSDEKKFKTSLIELPSLVFFLILKSFCQTWGRISGSLKYRVLCL